MFLPNGRIDHVTAPVVNIGETEREGIDASLNAHFESGFGDFYIGLNVSKYLTVEEPEFDKYGGFSDNLYSIRGRTYYLALSQTF
ncbi:hypothetical protein [Thalassotalea sp. ND16A]|uniref:hypothetical protein n=1 Tax=Thalassotalea sp. ND16A TaxID=1535422 RepID=UPI00051A3224|nr:hypothetical protein [Thalassotalea sp. ND16A]KGJ99077.1 hypothetical protein ND16A_0378 [Thalassotalea sp. ND16A]